MSERSAVIIVDTGYSLESMQAARKIIAILDVKTGSVVSGFPYMTWEHHADALSNFAGDPLNHGSMVLQALMNEAPNLPVILIRAYDERGLIRTTWQGGKILRPGWTEAYLTAVHICKVLGLNSVANFSFGGYTHAADGSGWESYCLGSVTGPGKPGHVVVAGAGTGSGINIHSSWKTEPGQTTEIVAHQDSAATYNFWCAADAESPQYSDWLFELFLNGEKLTEEYGANLIPNLWNNRKQVTFRVEGAGEVRIRTTRWSSEAAREFSPLPDLLPRATADGAKQPFHCVKKPSLSLVRKQADAFKFDCWINQMGCDATFQSHKDPMLIAEPAIFPHVISVGLTSGEYAADQDEFGAKPDILIEGDGPISFRLPELTAEIAGMLAEDSTLDSISARDRIRTVAATATA